MALFALIPFLPLLAAFLLALGGKRWGERSHLIGIPAIGLSFGLSVAAFFSVVIHGPFTISLYRLFQSGNLAIDLTLFVDQLTVLLLLLVTGVSGIVHVYSSRYMIGDPRYNRFFAVIALFTSSMVLLVMSGNLLMLLVSWEVMGICSYLLISHAAQRSSACRAATKAFLVNAVADVGLSFGIILTFVTFGTLDIHTILMQAEEMQDRTINVLGWTGWDFSFSPVALIPFFLFMGAMGKSAQLPFHVWLPFAMEAPTPVSALIHAATMVNAGPFLLVRLSPLIVLSPWAMMWIAFVGMVTAVFAGIVSLTQSDIKKILAYSTMSQIGFMIMTCGLGAFAVAIFHLLAHGCYKAFYFLSSGNALRSVEPGHRHGGVESLPPQETGVLYRGSFLLALIPPFVLFSGGYEYVWGVTGMASASIGFKLIGCLTVFVAALSIFRGVTSVFSQGPRTYWPESGPHGKARPIIRPRFFHVPILAAFVVTTVVMIGVLTLLWRGFANFLAPALMIPNVQNGESSFGGGPSIWLFVAIGMAIAGWGVALWTQREHPPPIPAFKRKHTAWYMFFWNKGYCDEIYDAYVVNPTLRVAQLLWRQIDVRVIDRFIHGIASYSVQFAQWLWRIVDIKGIDRLVMGIGQQSVGIGRWLWQVVDVQWLEQKVTQMGRQADTAGQLLQEAEPRTLQHQLLVMILWLVLAIVLLYLAV